MEDGMVCISSKLSSSYLVVLKVLVDIRKHEIIVIIDGFSYRDLEHKGCCEGIVGKSIQHENTT